MKKRAVLVLATIGISISFPQESLSCGGVDKHWAKPEIIYLRDQGIMTRDSLENFRPDDFITRAEFMNAINETFNHTKKKDINFKDVSKDSWYYDDIKKALAVGYIGGYGDGTIRPNATLTREEAAKIIAIASGLEKELPKSLHRFKDVDDISRWSIVYVHILAEKGYMSGYDDGTFRPRQRLKRGEAASILANIRKELGVSKPIISSGYSVQAGAFSSLPAARVFKKKLNINGFDNTFIIKYSGSDKYTVLVDSFLNLVEAKNLAEGMKTVGISSFITDRNFTEKEIVEKPDSLNNFDDLTYDIITQEVPKGSPKEEKNEEKEVNYTVIKTGKFALQAGSFSKLDAARSHKKELIKKGFSSTEIYTFPGNSLYFVVVDYGLNDQEAKSLKGYLGSMGFESYITDKDFKIAKKIN